MLGDDAEKTDVEEPLVAVQPYLGFRRGIAATRENATVSRLEQLGQQINLLYIVNMRNSSIQLIRCIKSHFRCEKS